MLNPVAFSPIDLAGLAYFVAAWGWYNYTVQNSRDDRPSLTRIMTRYRRAWKQQILTRDNRVVDTTINASLQNGTAFFASTTLIALGSVLTLSRSGDDVLTLFGALPFGAVATRVTWEVKVAGLAVIFVYAFFKFVWAYRLFNYAAILIGAIPPRGSATPEAAMQRAARRAAAMNVSAGRHFDKGQRAFLFALAYLGWFVSAPVFMLATTGAVFVMWRRQFASGIRAALIAELDEEEGHDSHHDSRDDDL